VHGLPPALLPSAGSFGTIERSTHIGLITVWVVTAPVLSRSASGFGISYIDGNKEAGVRIVGQVGTHLENYAYGVAFLDININFWDREFAQVAELEREVISLR
jgi:hypothetical protein